MASQTLLPLQQLADEHDGTYTDGRFVTLNSIIEEERAELQVADCKVQVYHTLRKSARPSMSASFWRLQTVVPGRRKLWIRIYRRNARAMRWPWRKVIAGASGAQWRWECHGYRQCPGPRWLQQKNLCEALAASDASAVHMVPYQKRGTRLEMHLRGSRRTMRPWKINGWPLSG